MGQVGLRLHPDKTQIVYCKDSNRQQNHHRTAFTFLGYTFRPRPARDRHGKTFLAFLPPISAQALKKISIDEVVKAQPLIPPGPRAEAESGSGWGHPAGCR